MSSIAVGHPQTEWRSESFAHPFVYDKRKVCASPSAFTTHTYSPGALRLPTGPSFAAIEGTCAILLIPCFSVARRTSRALNGSISTSLQLDYIRKRQRTRWFRSQSYCRWRAGRMGPTAHQPAICDGGRLRLRRIKKGHENARISTQRKIGQKSLFDFQNNVLT